MFGKKVKLSDEIYEMAKSHCEQAGYSTLEEFVEHCIEKEVQQNAGDVDQEKIKDRLKGLGYIS